MTRIDQQHWAETQTNIATIKNILSRYESIVCRQQFARTLRLKPKQARRTFLRAHEFEYSPSLPILLHAIATASYEQSVPVKL